MESKVFRIILIFLIIIIINSTMVIKYSLASSRDGISVNNFVSVENSTGTGKFSETLGKALGVIQVVAVGTSIIMLIVLGIKYMTSSVSERAEIKKHMIIFTIGAVLIFGSSGIVKLIIDFTKTI